MIEDALKVTRNHQRLVLVATVVALVFLASLGDTAPEIDLLSRIAKLRTLDEDYVEWLSIRWQLSEDGTQHVREWRENRLPKELLEAGVRPLHVERYDRIEDASLPDVSLSWLRASLEDRDFHYLNATFFCLVPRPAVDRLLRESPWRFSASSRLEFRLTDPLAIAIELDRPGRQHKGSYRDQRVAFRIDDEEIGAWDLPVKVVVLPESSLADWFNANDLPPLKESRFWEYSTYPPLDPRENLNDLIEELNRRIAAARAAGRTIEIVGISLPGSLALFGIPIVLIGFQLSLLIHLRHLHQLARDHRQVFRQFAWTPVSPGELWQWETALVLALPVFVHLLLVYRAPAFGNALAMPELVGIAGAFGSAAAGVALFRAVQELRRRIYLT